MTQLKYFLQQSLDVFLEQRDRWMLWIPVFIAMGIGSYFSLSFEPPLWVGVTILLFLTSGLLLFWRVALVNLLFFICFLMVLGFVSADFRTMSIDSPMLQKRLGPVMVEGIITELDTLPENKGWRLILSDISLSKLDKKYTPKRVRVQVYKKAIEKPPSIGQKIAVLSILNAPSSPVMPKAFDFRRYMFFENIGGTGFAIGNVKVLSEEAKKTSFWEVKREQVQAKIKVVFPESHIVASLVTALLTGERKAITDATWTDIRSAGLAHLLAISGLHIGLVAGFIFFMMRALLALSETITLQFSIKKISAVVALLGTIGYLCLVGMPVSAERATIMTGIVLIAIVLDREGMTLRLAAIAATIILLLMPEALLGAGFQMSFAAVVALIATYEVLSPYWRGWYQNSSFLHRMALYIFGSMLTTVIASLATAPFSLFHFHRVADWMSLLANIISVPLTSFIVMPAGLISLLMMPFGLESIPLQIMGLGVDGIYNVAHDITARGDHMIHSPVWELYALLLMIFGGLWLAIWRGNLRLFGILPIIIGIILAVQTASYMQPDIYISDTGEVMAVRLENKEFALSSIRKNKFVTENWRRRAGQEQQEAKKWPNNGELNQDFNCDWLACYWKDIVFVRNPIVFIKACNKENVIIAPKDVIPKTCKAKIKIDRFDLWYKGGHILYFDNNKLRIETVAKTLGTRPWVLDKYKNDKKFFK